MMKVVEISSSAVLSKEYKAYYNLGNYHRTITTSSSEAQAWFDYGLIWSFAFNHEESAYCFQQAITADYECAMAYWGLAYALGPNYNKPWEAFDASELGSTVTRTHSAVLKATEYASNASEVEKALIEALNFRYPKSLAGPPNELLIWNEEYANAMGFVYHKYSADLDVAALFADALMNLKPWALWDLRTGEPTPGAITLQVQEILENAIKSPSGTEHPGLLHLYIHFMEMSSSPEAAISAADHLQNLVPDGGHLCHMPSHIYMLCGDYKSGIQSNLAATKADHKFLTRSGNLNFYSLYRCHDYHFLIYGAMFAGQSKVALKAMDDLESTLPETLLRIESPPMADWLESFISIRVHILIRFGLWDKLLNLDIPQNAKIYCVTIAMIQYGKGVAFAAKGDIDAADQQRILFEEALTRVKSSRTLFNNTCTDILAIAKEMLVGEIEYRKGSVSNAFKHLRKAIDLEDNLPYDEPWGWMQPTRHALGALSLEQGLVEEAAAIYKADLGLDETLPRAQRHLNNVWALHGYYECLVKLQKNDEATAIKQKLNEAMEGVDVPIVSSCFCRLETEKVDGKAGDCC